ncbi:MAG: ribose-5-phosphate isomerase RpiA [Chloroflexota bacterium]
MTIQQQKTQAAEMAVTFIQPGMIVGLGTGTTAIIAVRLIAERLQSGRLNNIICIPTSLAIEDEATRLQIPLTTLEEHPSIDLTIDGADEVDPNLDVIKGGGGALLREKIVAQASQRELIIVDESKPSNQLGTKWAVPVEVIPFGWSSQHEFLVSLGAKVVRRTTSEGLVFETDHGNYILDCNFGPIADPNHLATQLNNRVGIVEHGLFLNMVTDVIIASQEGIQHKQR